MFEQIRINLCSQSFQVEIKQREEIEKQAQHNQVTEMVAIHACGEYPKVGYPIVHQEDRILALEKLKNLCALRCILLPWYVLINFLAKSTRRRCISEVASDLRRALTYFENPGSTIQIFFVGKVRSNVPTNLRSEMQSQAFRFAHFCSHCNISKPSVSSNIGKSLYLQITVRS